MKDISREFTLELVRVTEAAALKASRWVGKGDKEAADQAAVDAMRGMLDLINIKGTVVIGEGEKDEAPMLYIGEKVGGGGKDDPVVDIAVDPLDGTELTSQGKPNAVTVLAAGNKDSLTSFPSFYVDKIAVGPKAKGCIDINDTVANNLKMVARSYGRKVTELTAIVLDRPRHDKLIAEIRKVGTRIRLLPAGDVAGAIATAMENSEVDILFGVGGAPEGVLAAAALKCLGGEMQVKMYAKDDEEKKKLLKLGCKEKDFHKVYKTEDLVKGDSIIFSATGVTGGYFLPAVQYKGNMAITHSVVMRAKTRTVRYIKAYHHLDIKTIPSRKEEKEVGI
jgi:fructose-1,6-bisphosphatase II